MCERALCSLTFSIVVVRINVGMVDTLLFLCMCVAVAFSIIFKHENITPGKSRQQQQHTYRTAIYIIARCTEKVEKIAETWRAKKKLTFQMQACDVANFSLTLFSVNEKNRDIASENLSFKLFNFQI